MFNELINEISKDIQKHEKRSRLRTTEEQSRFQYAVKYILTDLWKACYSIPIRECSINLRSGYYSENLQYLRYLQNHEKQKILVSNKNQVEYSEK